MRHRLLPFCLLVAAIFCGSRSMAQPEKPRIGVMNLEAATENAPLARQATVALTSALVSTRMFEVLDQSGMVQEFLTGIARQHVQREQLLETLRGEECAETQCLADLGQALEARFMVAGGLTGSGSSSTVAVRLVDVYSASILAYPTRSMAGDAAESIGALMAEIADDLVRALPGEVRLFGLPTDASVFVDGQAVRWRGDRPLDLAPGRHTIRAARRGFGEAATTVDVEYGPPIERRLTLPPKSRMGAIGRSLFVPGLGQFYGERPGRGTFYLVAELVALGGAGYAVYANTRANSDYDDAKSQYASLAGPDVTQQQFDAARAKMTDAYDRAKSTRQWSLVAIGALAGLHLVNVLDAGIGFPNLSHVRIVEGRGGTSMIRIQVRLAGRSGR